VKRQDDNGENTLHVDATGGAGTSVDLVGINGTAPSTGLGASDGGTLRVAISSDSPSAGNPAAGPTGAAVPAQADYQGVNVGGTLRGATGVNPSGSIFAEQVDLASIAGTTTATGNGVVSAGVQRVAIASDNTAFSVNATLAANQSVNVTQLAGTATSVNSGVKDAGTLRVVLATDQPQLTNKLLVTPDANAAINLAQVNGQTVNVGTGAAGTGTQRVTTSTDSTIGTVTSITNAVTVSQATAANLNATVVGTGTFAVQAALQAGSALVGSVELESNTMTAGGTSTTPKFAKIAASTNGDNTLVAAVVGKKIRVLGYNFIANGTVNAKFQSGAGGTDLTGLKYCVANMGISVSFSPVGWFETASNTLLNLNLSAGIAVGGELVYVEV
jgi:hypothetical protein